MVESEVERIDSAFKANFDLLAQAGTFHMMDRDGDADELQNATNRRVALAGLGGIGKSQIAIEYAYIYRERHPQNPVFWVHGSDPVRFEESYHHITRRMALPGWNDQEADALQLVHDALSSDESGEWLFILDNADDESMFHGKRPSKPTPSSSSQTTTKSFARYIPQNASGSAVLITTRDRRVGERLSGRHKPVDVSAMTPAESTDLLRSKMAEEDWCEEDAMKLVAELSHLPLAITQAAAFISENCLSIAEYLETLFAGDDDAAELLSEHLEDPRRDIDTENSVVRTWKLSFDQISRNVPRAAEILSLAAILDYHNVPVMLLRKPKETETSFRMALGALQAFSLLTATRGKDAVCKMHRLVALATQRWLDARGTLDQWKGRGVCILAETFPGPGRQRYEERPLYETLVPHTAMALAGNLETDAEQLAAARLMVAVALYNMSRGRYARAYDLCNASLEIRQLLPAEDELTLDSVQTLGEALLHRGDSGLAATMLRQAVAGRGKTLGDEHPDTLESLSGLTITLLELDELDEAERTAMRALEGRRRVLGEQHSDTLVSLNIHCILLHRRGRLEEARAQYATTLEGQEALLGLEHPDTIITRNNYARLLFDVGDFEAARAMLDRVLAGEAEVLGAEGYDIQVSLSTSALLQAARGDVAGADLALRKVLRMREKLLGGAHPSTIFTLQMLADLHGEEGGSLEAAGKVRRTIEERRKKNGGGGPEKASALLRAGLLFD
ncbi:P-loop containing nucleoside triphosphate hydrolase protein [Cercophora scortea]|uniref:P-loop containing nucleoside triphosphate hydrolase protein n=1 Tax=Cercophora scortea TaxID=314031 RepID=A0AAE0M664_9PEZI|nr:P-loop containing nucleoside triphosphate hydrolase protein [Cercophora scortea]